MVKWGGEFPSSSWRRGQNLPFQCLLGFGLLDLGSVAAPETRDKELPRKWDSLGTSFLGHKSSTEPCCPGQLPASGGASPVQCPAVSVVAGVNTEREPQPVGLGLFLIWLYDGGVI